jgi:hypothetical protein
MPDRHWSGTLGVTTNEQLFIVPPQAIIIDATGRRPAISSGATDTRILVSLRSKSSIDGLANSQVDLGKFDCSHRCAVVATARQPNEVGERSIDSLFDQPVLRHGPAAVAATERICLFKGCECLQTVMECGPRVGGEHGPPNLVV